MNKLSSIYVKIRRARNLGFFPIGVYLDKIRMLCKNVIIYPHIRTKCGPDIPHNLHLVPILEIYSNWSQNWLCIKIIFIFEMKCSLGSIFETLSFSPYRSITPPLIYFNFIHKTYIQSAEILWNPNSLKQTCIILFLKEAFESWISSSTFLWEFSKI